MTPLMELGQEHPHLPILPLLQALMMGAELPNPSQHHPPHPTAVVPAGRMWGHSSKLSPVPTSPGPLNRGHAKMGGALERRGEPWAGRRPEPRRGRP